MKRIGQFHKVSLEQFQKDFQDTFMAVSSGEVKQIYEEIKLPQRATSGSAGYDFYTPIKIF
ncbi:MAG: deoxyuridine 5'-triphosphate nucleotidohydrolase, partial [Lachnospiraceae bacterium]